MSSCWGSVCLLVLLGVVFASGSPCRFIMENLTQTHEAIADELRLKEIEVGNNPLFSSVIRGINNSHQRKEEQLMNATLDIYMRIFSSILQRHHDQQHDEALLDQVPDAGKRSEVEKALVQLQRKMKELKSKLSHPKHDGEDVISKLSQIQVDNPVDQKKALAEFKEVYQAASVIVSRRCGQH